MVNPRAVSVIIPAANQEAFIADAIRSALEQTLPPHEVIVMDDASTDRTAGIAQSFGAAVTLISGIFRGSGPARNRGSQAATGEWLAFLDADDLWLPEKLERQFAAMEDADVFSCTDRYNFGAVNGLPSIQSSVNALYSGDVFEPLLHGNFVTTSTVLLRHDVFRAIGGFATEPALIVGQDWDLWLRVSHQHRLSVCREPLVRYRIHDDGASRRIELMARARLRAVDRALASPRGQRLSPAAHRDVVAGVHRANGFDWRRFGQPRAALRSYLRAIATAPFHVHVYADIVRTVLGR